MAELLVERGKRGVVEVTLNRPKAHNALTPELIKALTATFDQLSHDEEARVVVLTGAGRSFCAGADLNYMRAAADFDFADNVTDGKAIFDLMNAIDGCPKVVVGRINGAAIGGGAGLTSCCDIAIAVERAKFAFSEVRLGIVPATISPFVLGKIGATHARELFLTGERFTASQAQTIGLVQHVVVDEAALDIAVEERVAHLLLGAPAAQATIKQLLRQVPFRPKSDLRDDTATLIAERRASDEGREGMSSFLEKRPPRWAEDA